MPREISKTERIPKMEGRIFRETKAPISVERRFHQHKSTLVPSSEISCNFNRFVCRSIDRHFQQPFASNRFRKGNFRPYGISKNIDTRKVVDALVGVHTSLYRCILFVNTNAYTYTSMYTIYIFMRRSGSTIKSMSVYVGVQ